MAMLLEAVAGSLFPHPFLGFGGEVFAAVLLLVSLALMFAGRAVIKGLAFLAVGLAGAAFGASAGGLFLGVTGTGIGAVVGFLVGGALGLLLVDVGLGLALGYFGYLVTRDLTGVFLLALVAGIILFFVGVAVSTRLLELATAVLGGVMIYGVLIFFGVSAPLSTVVSLALAVIGFAVQFRSRHRAERWRQI
jgi:hypothetical protein